MVSPTAAFDALTYLLVEPKLVKKGLPSVVGTPGARWLSLGGQFRLPWQKAGLDLAEIWNSVAAIK